MLVSGTSSIVGYESMHNGDLDAQLRETLANLNVLLELAHAAGRGPAARLGAGSLVKVYLRDARHAAHVAQELSQRLGADVPTMILAADICRSELLVEVEAVHRA
jgi:chorismate lyase/3-hydroxybenzoate synthase